MKQEKKVKSVFKKNGLTTYNNYKPIGGYNSGATNCVVIYNDLSASTYYAIANNPTGKTQLIVDATPSGISWTLTGVSTQQISVVNSYGTNVITNCAFASSKTDVASVNITGLITKGASTGTTSITVSYQDANYKLLVLSDIITVTVV